VSFSVDGPATILQTPLSSGLQPRSCYVPNPLHNTMCDYPVLSGFFSSVRMVCPLATILRQIPPGLQGGLINCAFFGLFASRKLGPVGYPLDLVLYRETCGLFFPFARVPFFLFGNPRSSHTATPYLIFFLFSRDPFPWTCPLSSNDDSGFMFAL